MAALPNDLVFETTERSIFPRTRLLRLLSLWIRIRLMGMMEFPFAC